MYADVALGVHREHFEKAIRQPIEGSSATHHLAPRPVEPRLRRRFALFLARYSWACKLSPRRKLLPR